MSHIAHNRTAAKGLFQRAVRGALTWIAKRAGSLKKGLPTAKENRGDPRFTFGSESPGQRLLMQVLPEIIEFSAEDVLELNGGKLA